LVDSASTTKNAWDTSSRKIRIGVRVHDLGVFFNGTIDEVRIYNRALSEAEIKALYYNGLTNKFNLTFLMSYEGTSENIGYNFTALIYLENGSTLVRNFYSENGFGVVNSFHEVNLEIENYNLSYGEIEKIKVCSSGCTYICAELEKETQC